jgi:hypothetical protein
VAPFGIPRGRYFQVYAPNQNENVYTSLWQGRYYGYERVIETFELTETPRRLKPVNIYYHTYSATKTASLAALHKVYAWALGQPLHPVYASEYIERVLDFNRAVVVRTAAGWRVRGLGALRTVRAPRSLGYPQGDIAGYALHGDEVYLHLVGEEAEIRFSPAPSSAPAVREANARITALERHGNAMRLSLDGHVPIQFSLQSAERCEVRYAGRLVAAGRDGRYPLAVTQAHGVDIRCP